MQHHAILFCLLLQNNHPTGLGVMVSYQGVEVDTTADWCPLFVMTVPIDRLLAGEVVSDRLVSDFDGSDQAAGHIVDFHCHRCPFR